MKIISFIKEKQVIRKIVVHLNLWDTPEECRVHLSIYAIVGRRIAVLQDRQVSAGTHQVTWRATDDHGTPVSRRRVSVQNHRGCL